MGVSRTYRNRWAFVRARHHGLLRLAPTLPVSVARVRQVDVVPVGVSDRQVLPGCVGRVLAVGLYKGSFSAGLAHPGSSWFMAECAVVGLTSIGRPPWWEEASPQRSCRLLPCAWLAQDLCRARVAVRRRCRSCGQVRLRVLRVSHASHRSAVEGTQDIVQKGRVCRPGPCLSADGELLSFAQRQRPDLMDRGVRQHSRGHRLCCGPRVYGWPLCPAPRGSVTRERRVRWDDKSGCGAAPFSCCRRVAGFRELRPPSKGCGRRSLGLQSCRTPWAAKASLYSLGARCTCRVG